MSKKELREILKVEVNVIDIKINNLKIQKNIILRKLEELCVNLKAEM